nr:MAG TPA: hypothetical protein [Caudoviricetes sp.]
MHIVSTPFAATPLRFLAKQCLYISIHFIDMPLTRL